MLETAILTSLSVSRFGVAQAVGMAVDEDVEQQTSKGRTSVSRTRRGGSMEDDGRNDDEDESADDAMDVVLPPGPARKTNGRSEVRALAGSSSHVGLS